MNTTGKNRLYNIAAQNQMQDEQLMPDARWTINDAVYVIEKMHWNKNSSEFIG